MNIQDQIDNLELEIIKLEEENEIIKLEAIEVKNAIKKANKAQDILDDYRKFKDVHNLLDTIVQLMIEDENSLDRKNMIEQNKDKIKKYKKAVDTLKGLLPTNETTPQ